MTFTTITSKFFLFHEHDGISTRNFLVDRSNHFQLEHEDSLGTSESPVVDSDSGKDDVESVDDDDDDEEDDKDDLGSVSDV